MEAKVEEQHNIRAWADQRVERSREFGLNQNTKQLPPIYPPLILASSSSLDLSTLSVQRIAGSVIHDDLCSRHIGNVWWILEYDDTFQSIKSIRLHGEWGIGSQVTKMMRRDAQLAACNDHWEIEAYSSGLQWAPFQSEELLALSQLKPTHNFIPRSCWLSTPSTSFNALEHNFTYEANL